MFKVRGSSLVRKLLFKMRDFFLLQKSLCHITVHQAILQFTSSSTAINLKLLLNLALCLTWHNSVQVQHILHAIICQYTVVFVQHLHNLRPQAMLNLRMQCKLVQGESHCISRSLVACYQKNKRLCYKQVAVYFWKKQNELLLQDYSSLCLLVRCKCCFDRPCFCCC